MEYQPQVQNNGKIGKAKGIWKRARTESAFTRVWFITFAIISLGLTLIIPLGCLSPPTKHFALFSVNPRILGHRYNIRNNTGHTYGGKDLDGDLTTFPDAYRVGISGVCREYFNASEIRCTKTFPQVLNLATMIDADIAALPNATASHLQSFWDNITHDAKVAQLENTTASLVKASAGLTITSLVLAPLFFAVIILMFMLKRPGYPTVAASLAIFDAVLIVLAAALWITASAQYTSAIESIVGSIINENRSFGGATDLFPLSLGLYLFLLAALAKLIVVPFMALIVLVLLFILIICAILFIWIVFLLFICLLAMCGGDDNKVTVETQYYNYPTNNY